MDYQPKRYLSKFNALAVELRKKMRTTVKSCNKKNQVAIEKAKKQKKRDRSVSKLKVIPLFSISPRFPSFSLHQSSTNILPQIMIYQMFAKAEVSTGSYNLSIYDSLWKLLST